MKIFDLEYNLKTQKYFSITSLDMLKKVQASGLLFDFTIS
jgi:hypothetical protein